MWEKLMSVPLETVIDRCLRWDSNRLLKKAERMIFEREVLQARKPKGWRKRARLMTQHVGLYLTAMDR
jgi:hypothetical protein